MQYDRSVAGGNGVYERRFRTVNVLPYFTLTILASHVGESFQFAALITILRECILYCRIKGSVDRHHSSGSLGG